MKSLVELFKSVCIYGFFCAMEESRLNANDKFSFKFVFSLRRQCCHVILICFSLVSPHRTWVEAPSDGQKWLFSVSLKKVTESHPSVVTGKAIDFFSSPP